LYLETICGAMTAKARDAARTTPIIAMARTTWETDLRLMVGAPGWGLAQGRGILAPVRV